MKQTVPAWLNYLYTLHTSRIDLGLQRIQEIVEEQGYRHFSCPVIMVAGTNGKGSCVRILESIYTAAGYRVGAYSSPHLQCFNERIRIAGQEVDDATLMAAFSAVEAFRKDRPLSFFEFTSLAAFSIFAAAHLDVLLLEVGLGGRLDAVNVIEPDVAVVTSIGLDHVDWLGNSREKIAYEKAGIYRAGKPAICGDGDPPASLIEHAESIGAEQLFINKQFKYTVAQKTWSWSGLKKQVQQLPMPSLKCQNAATSLMALECLDARLPVTVEAVSSGIKNARLPGRFEAFSTPVKGILDVAHNPDSAAWLAEQLAEASASSKKVALVGMLNDKDIGGTIDPLLPHIDAWFVAGLQADRAADPQDIVKYLKSLGVESCYNFCTVSEAWKRATQACTAPEDQVIVFGSFHTVAEVKEELAKNN